MSTRSGSVQCSSHTQMRTCSRGTVHPCSFAHMMKNVRNDTSRLMSAGRLGPLLEAGHQRASFLLGGRDLGIEQAGAGVLGALRSEEHTSELQSLMRISYAVFCLQKKKTQPNTP